MPGVQLGDQLNGGEGGVGSVRLAGLRRSFCSLPGAVGAVGIGDQAVT